MFSLLPAQFFVFVCSHKIVGPEEATITLQIILAVVGQGSQLLDDIALDDINLCMMV
jgi:hypothetical protein